MSSHLGFLSSGPKTPPTNNLFTGGKTSGKVLKDAYVFDGGWKCHTRCDFNSCQMGTVSDHGGHGDKIQDTNGGP
jgi:hypothetical protein